MLLLLGGCIQDTPSTEEQSYICVGDRLPSFEVMLNDGTEVSPATLQGAPAIVVLFTIDCGDCRRFLPVLEEVYEELTGVQMVLIARSVSAERLAIYWREHGLSMPYSAQEDASVYHLFARIGVPRVYVVNSDGIVTAAWSDVDMPDSATLITALCEAEKE